MPFVFVLVNVLLFIIENEEHFRENYITFWLRSIFPGGSVGKESVCNVGDQGSIPRLKRTPGEENGSPLQYSCLENAMDNGTSQTIVHGVIKSQT